MILGAVSPGKLQNKVVLHLEGLFVDQLGTDPGPVEAREVPRVHLMDLRDVPNDPVNAELRHLLRQEGPDQFPLIT